MGITFRTKVEDVWVDCSNEVFDKTEIGRFDKEDRKKILFNLRPFTPVLERDIRNKILEKKGKNLIDLDSDSPLSTLNSDINISKDPEYQDMVLDTVIKGWEGIVDQNNSPIPCTLEHKIALFEGYYPVLGSVLFRTSRELVSKIDLYETKEKEKLVKNSHSSQDGTVESAKKK